MAKVLLEICCSSIDDAIEAERGGADRVELCSALFLGGLTPSLGTQLETKSRLRIPIIFMVRPRSGGFCYTEAEFAKYAGWGHSTWQEGVRLADAAKVKQLVLFHHDPSHDDAFMDQVVAEANKLRPGTIAAREVMELSV